MTTKKKITIMGGIKDFISECPALVTFLEALRQEIGVEYLDEESGSYSIESEPIEPWVKRYADGSGVKQYSVVFSSREDYGKQTVEALANCGFYEELTDWIEECNANRRFPDFGEHKSVKKMLVTTTPYVFDATHTTAKYQAEIQFQYYQEAYVRKEN